MKKLIDSLFHHPFLLGFAAHLPTPKRLRAGRLVLPEAATPSRRTCLPVGREIAERNMIYGESGDADSP
jgi:hypothetical protein